MNLKHIASTIAASMLLAIMPVVPANAEYTFPTVQDFLGDVMTVAVSGTDASSAINAVNSDISVSGEQVLYKGSAIGYWSDAVDTTLYADSAKTEPLIEKSGSGYKVDPDILDLLLTDVNDNISTTYTPTTDDWTNIVGKYDITLGDVTIPANQWLKADSFYDVTGSGNGMGKDAIQWNLSTISGITVDNVGIQYGDNSMHAFAWLIDDTGELYVQNGIIGLSAGLSGPASAWVAYSDTLTSNSTPSAFSVNGTTATPGSTVPYIRCGVINSTTASNTTWYDPTEDTTNTHLAAILYVTDAAVNTYGKASSFKSSSDTSATSLHKLSDPAVVNTCKIEDAKAYGVAYMLGSQIGATNTATLHTKHAAMVGSYSCSKTVTGNKILSGRLSKLSLLDPSDYVVVTDSDWSVNGTTSLDAYIATQTLTEAGMPASMDGSVEIEERCFKVVVPSSLPMSADLAGNVLTATNATISNKSNADVKITDLSITPVNDSGWTLVEGEPSTVRGSNEFSFETSLSTGDVITQGDELGFTYRAKMSPADIGVTQADIVTITVTLDWTE